MARRFRFGAIGIAYAASTRRTPQAYVDNLMAGGALGVPLWGLISVVALPVLSRQRLEWTGEEMRAHFPALVVWILYGALLGLFAKAPTPEPELAQLRLYRESNRKLSSLPHLGGYGNLSSQ